VPIVSGMVYEPARPEGAGLGRKKRRIGETGFETAGTRFG
jgi:hypothetical protein